MTHLEKIDAKNLWDVVELKVARSQKNFVADNRDSILEAYLAVGTECKAFPFAIYNDKTPVGFLMIDYNEAAMYGLYDEEPPASVKNNYSLWRLMIDKKYQGKGYGKEAVRLALEFIRTWPCGKAEFCELSYEPENEIAKKLYSSFGFVERPDFYKEGDEMLAVLEL